MTLNPKVVMPAGPYSPCPCGSGKQFKWCCSPFYAEIEHALDQESKGQHETAMRLINKVVEAHPTNPEAWGQKARLLWMHKQQDEADETLNKAFELNPNYPFGLLLRARFRWDEGEVGGALLLARRAADAYAPEATDYLVEVYSILFQAEMRMHRPLAGRAALRLATRCAPDNQQLLEVFNNLFGPNGQLPACARQDYPLLQPPPSIQGERRASWDKAISTASLLRLGDLARLFAGLVKEDPGNPAAWFNLGLSRSWLGENPAALDAFSHFLELNPTDEQATRAGAMMEVLRTGFDLYNQSDYQEWAFVFRLGQNPEPMMQQLNEWQAAHQLIVTKTQDEQVFVALILEFASSGVLLAGQPVAPLAPVAGYILISQGVVRVWGFSKPSIERLRETLRKRLQLPFGEAAIQSEPLAFHEVTTEAMVFPTNPTGEIPQDQILDHIRKFYEEKWIQQPRRSLAGNTPKEAATQPVGRRRLLGLIQFLEDCSKQGHVKIYDWNRLRQLLGVGVGQTPGTSPAAPSIDIAAADVAHLTALKDESLSLEQLEQAYQRALKLSDEELAVRFALALLAHPPQENKNDRYPWFSYLAQKAQRDNNLAPALEQVEAGEAFDSAHNEGRRANDYALRRGQIHAKRGEADMAQTVFQRLLEQAPTELKYRITATETMLSLKQAPQAVRFAEEGLAKARQQNDRDSEQAFQELLSAARKQMG